MKLAKGMPVKWKRTKAPSLTKQEEEEEKTNIARLPQYEERLIECTRCGAQQETKKVQLHTKDGFRDIHCPHCKKHERCIRNTCQCKLIWHQCSLHRKDPPVHATRKVLWSKRTRRTSEKQEEERKLSSKRKSPCFLQKKVRTRTK